MEIYMLIVMIIAVTIFVVAGMLSKHRPACQEAESHLLCFREWLKAANPFMTLLAIMAALFAATAAWRNLSEIQKGTYARAAEILRQRLKVIYAEQKMMQNFDQTGSRYIFQSLADPVPAPSGWVPADPQQAKLKEFVRALDPYSSSLWSFQVMNDTTDPTPERAKMIEATETLFRLLAALANGPASTAPDSVKHWRDRFSEARAYFGKNWSSANVMYANRLASDASSLQAAARKFDRKIISDIE